MEKKIVDAQATGIQIGNNGPTENVIKLIRRPKVLLD